MDYHLQMYMKFFGTTHRRIKMSAKAMPDFRADGTIIIFG